MRLFTKLRLFVLSLAAIVLAGSSLAYAAADMPLVTDNPVNYTPRVIGGWVGEGDAYRTVIDYAKIGDNLYAGGVIDTVANSDGVNYGTTFGNLFRFNSKTGVVDESFHPMLAGSGGGLINGVVNALEKSPDGKFLFIGGEFKTVNGTSRTGLAKWNLTQNKLVTGFDAKLDTLAGNTGNVYDLKFANGQLLVGTSSTNEGNVLISVDPATGAKTNYASGVPVGVKVRDDGVAPRVYKIAVSPDATRAVIIGNFREVGGEERLQIAMIKLLATTTELAPWYARDAMAATTPPPTGGASATSCGTSRDWCLMDVDWSPNGNWFAVVASGGPGMTYPSIKDAVTRWEKNDNDNNAPKWLNYSDGDTFHSVRATAKHVYAGGHIRWLNGKVFKDGVEQDVNRETHYGLGAIDAGSGRAVTDWNNSDTTGRGEGWRGMYVAPKQGLWVGGDADFIQGEPRNRLGLMPLP